MIERERLINKWMNEANMQIQREDVKSRFKELLESLSDVELARPFIIRERKEKTYNELAIAYNITKHHVISIIERGVTNILKQRQ